MISRGFAASSVQMTKFWNQLYFCVCGDRTQSLSGLVDFQTWDIDLFWPKQSYKSGAINMLLLSCISFPLWVWILSAFLNIKLFFKKNILKKKSFLLMESCRLCLVKSDAAAVCGQIKIKVFFFKIFLCGDPFHNVVKTKKTKKNKQFYWT